MGKKLKKVRRLAIDHEIYAEQQRQPEGTYNEYWEGEQAAYADIVRQINLLEAKL